MGDRRRQKHAPPAPKRHYGRHFEPAALERSPDVREVSDPEGRADHAAALHKLVGGWQQNHLTLLPDEVTTQ